MHANIGKDLADSTWEQLWEKNLYEYVVGNQTSSPYCPPQAPCNCSGGGSGGGPAGPNGGGAGGGDGSANGTSALGSNPGLTGAVNNKLQGYTGQDRDLVGPGRGPLTRDTSNDVKERYNTRTGERVNSGGGASEPGSNYEGDYTRGQKNAVGGGFAGGIMKVDSDGNVTFEPFFDPVQAVNEGAAALKTVLAKKQEPKKDCADTGGGGGNPNNGTGATGTTGAAAGSSQGTGNGTRPTPTTGSGQTTGNSAGGGRPAPRVGTGPVIR
jgi:hypothetical protein